MKELLTPDQYRIKMNLQEQERKRRLETKRAHCPGCGVPMIIKKKSKASECGTCKAIGPEKARAQWLQVQANSNTQYFEGVPNAN